MKNLFSSFKESISTIQIDWKYVFIAIIIIIAAIILNRIMRWLLKKYVEKTADQIPIDHTRYRFFRNGVSAFIWIIAIATIIYSIPQLKAVAITLFASAGILVAIIGFAAQQAFANIISGIFIVLFRPFRVGDLVKIGTDFYGIVEDITLRHTVITNFENRRIIIPNSVINSETLVNSSISDERICTFVDMGISYDSDINKAMEIITEEAIKHPNFVDNRTPEDIEAGKKLVNIKVIGFGDSSVNLRAWVWTEDPFKSRELLWDLNKSIKERFDREGVEIPFPYRTIVYKKDIEK